MLLTQIIATVGKKYENVIINQQCSLSIIYHLSATGYKFELSGEGKGLWGHQSPSWSSGLRSLLSEKVTLVLLLRKSVKVQLGYF